MLNHGDLKQRLQEQNVGLLPRCSFKGYILAAVLGAYRVAASAMLSASIGFLCPRCDH